MSNIKLLMLNPKTRDCKLTSSKPGSNKYSKFMKDGYIPICKIDGFMTTVYQIIGDLPVILNRPNLTFEVIEQIKDDINGNGTIEALEELIEYIPIENQLSYLNEDIVDGLVYNKKK